MGARDILLHASPGRVGAKEPHYVDIDWQHIFIFDLYSHFD